LVVELHHAIGAWIGNPVSEDRSAIDLAESAQLCAQLRPVEKIVTEHQCHTLCADEIPADHKCLRESVRSGLDSIRHGNTELSAVPQQSAKCRSISRCCDYQNASDAREYQSRQWVVDHRFVVDGQQLLTRADSDRVQSRAGAAGENYSAHDKSSVGAQ
jgi:hypothetical protein